MVVAPILRAARVRRPLLDAGRYTFRPMLWGWCCDRLMMVIGRVARRRPKRVTAHTFRQCALFMNGRLFRPLAWTSFRSNV